MKEQLELKFDPRTIEHLGIKMYSQIPAALAELIANAYDADATEVHIQLYDSDKTNKRVIVRDNGHGMKFESINEDFLVIGRKKRDYEIKSVFGRKPTGRKGLGKLALFGIGKSIIITTQKKGSNQAVEFIMDWEEILESSGSYKPKYLFLERNEKEVGTTIEVSHLKRSTKFNLHNLTLSIAKLFNFYDENFKIFISHNDGKKIEVTREHRIEGIDKQFEWGIEEVIKELSTDYEFSDKIKGTIVSSKKPLPANLRGITLYARGRQANEASFFGVSEAGHTYSYLTGWIEADFIDDQAEDFISTDRQQIEWDQHDLTDGLQKILQQSLRYIVKDWSNKRSVEKKKKISEKSSINFTEWLEKVPKEVQPDLESLINRIENQAEIEEEVYEDVIKDINKLVPEYTSFHYRFLHEEVQNASKTNYQAADYYNAFVEAMKRYKNKVKDKSGTKSDFESEIMKDAFGKDKLLKVPFNMKRPDGTDFSESTLQNIEEANKFLAMGIVQGGRNVLAHEEIKDLNMSGLFSEKDCLDFLSLLSHLFKRLDESDKREK